MKKSESFNYANVPATVHLWSICVKEEIDSSVSVFDLTKFSKCRYVRIHLKEVVKAMTVLTRQICASRVCSKFNIQITDDEFGGSAAFVFECTTPINYNESIPIEDYAPALGISREALSFCADAMSGEETSLLLSTYGSIVCIDFNFGNFYKKGTDKLSSPRTKKIIKAFKEALKMF